MILLPCRADDGARGASGAGKSTLAQVLLRFIEADEGAVLVNGVRLDSIDPAAWRGAVAWVPQRPHLFHGTVLDNLRVGRPGPRPPTSSEPSRMRMPTRSSPRCRAGWIRRSASKGSASRGARRSGWRARAFLRDAPIVILDEPTSQLDPDGDRRVVEAISAQRARSRASMRASLPGIRHTRRLPEPPND